MLDTAYDYKCQGFSGCNERWTRTTCCNVNHHTGSRPAIQHLAAWVAKHEEECHVETEAPDAG